jgi:hypothetical protein
MDGHSVKPGDNPNKLNAKKRTGVRPQTKNSPNGKSNQSMKMGWVDPLPVVDTIYPLGLEPNVKKVVAGEVELDIHLPEVIATPFSDTVASVADRVQISSDDVETMQAAMKSLAFFKAARQLFSTMSDYEKSYNQPLKSVFYDETPIPLHMAGALGMIGNIQTKVGEVQIRDISLLFKRWIAMGLKESSRDFTSYPGLNGQPNKFVWLTRDGHEAAKRRAREKIDELVKATYTVDHNGTTYTVSMPQLTDQDLATYYGQINNDVPHADELRALVAGLEASFHDFRDDTLPHGQNRFDFLAGVDMVEAPDSYSIENLRENFENWNSEYITQVKWRIESVFKVGPPPAGDQGFGAQTVSSTDNTAEWQFPLSDADVNIGFLFSPCKSFNLSPRLIGYSQRKREVAQAKFAYADGKAFV